MVFSGSFIDAIKIVYDTTKIYTINLLGQQNFVTGDVYYKNVSPNKLYIRKFSQYFYACYD